ncbi:hypothetical protein JXA47_01855 [Candidatus Sumerlaeota bacterium]|nr:hypothetical protein [Candidatus Sumerlaeota bacterium]
MHPRVAVAAALALALCAGAWAQGAPYSDVTDFSELWESVEDVNRSLDESVTRLAEELLAAKTELAPMLAQWAEMSEAERADNFLLRSQIEERASEVIATFIPALTELTVEADRATITLREIGDRIGETRTVFEVQMADNQNLIDHQLARVEEQGMECQRLAQMVRAAETDSDRHAAELRLRRAAQEYDRLYRLARHHRNLERTYAEAIGALDQYAELYNAAYAGFVEAAGRIESQALIMNNLIATRAPITQIRHSMLQMFSRSGEGINALVGRIQVIEESLRFIEEISDTLGSDADLPSDVMATIDSVSPRHTTDDLVRRFGNYSFERERAEILRD